MKTEFRTRAFLPVVIPLAILGIMGAVVGVISLILLYVDRQGAVALAILGAAGILLAVSLASGRDRLAAGHRAAIALAAGAPLAVGALVAAGVIGGLDDADRNINVQPHGPQFVIDGILEGVPVLAAETAASFCLDSGGGCQDTREWAFSYGADQIAYAFDNRDATSPHNLMIFNLESDRLSRLEAPIPLADLLDNYDVITPAPPPDIAGGISQTYQWDTPAEGEDPIPQQAYFVCTLHAGSMWGVVEMAADA